MHPVLVLITINFFDDVTHLSNPHKPVALKHANEHVQPESTRCAEDWAVDGKVLHEEKKHAYQVLVLHVRSRDGARGRLGFREDGIPSIVAA